MKVVGHWDGLPREAVEAPTLAVFTSWLDKALEQLVLVEAVWPVAERLRTR